MPCNKKLCKPVLKEINKRLYGKTITITLRDQIEDILKETHSTASLTNRLEDFIRTKIMLERDLVLREIKTEVDRKVFERGVRVCAEKQ